MGVRRKHQGPGATLVYSNLYSPKGLVCRSVTSLIHPTEDLDAENTFQQGHFRWGEVVVNSIK